VFNALACNINDFVDVNKDRGLNDSTEDNTKAAAERIVTTFIVML